MAGFNKAILMGNLVAKPIINNKNGTSWVKFRIGVSRNRKTESGETISDFFTCTAFGKTAEFLCKHFDKGQSVIVVGSLENSSYINETGEKIYSTSVMVSEAYFGASRTGEAVGEGVPSANGNGIKLEELSTEEDLPFN